MGAMGLGYLARDSLKILRRENVRQPVNEGANAVALADFFAQKGGLNLAEPFLDRVGSNFGEIQQRGFFWGHERYRWLLFWREEFLIHHLANDMAHEDMCFLDACTILALGSLK